VGLVRAAIWAGLPLLLQAFLVPTGPSQYRGRGKWRAIWGSQWIPLTLRQLGMGVRGGPAAMMMKQMLDGQEISGPLAPIHNVILVKVKEAADVSTGGIVLPDQVRPDCNPECYYTSMMEPDSICVPPPGQGEANGGGGDQRGAGADSPRDGRPYAHGRQGGYVPQPTT
jgi:hypothetical protein